MFKVNNDQYQGPLDVLLDLIRKKALDITKISLAQVTDEFVYHFQHADLSIPATTQFLEIVTILLRIKRKALFPNEEDVEDEQETTLLVKLFNKQYYSVLSDILDQWQTSSNGYFTKGDSEYIESVATLSPNNFLDGVNLLKLSVTFNYLVNQKEEPPKYTIEKHNITVADQMEWLKKNLTGNKHKLSSIIYDMPDRYSAVITFLAILESIRIGIIVIIALNNNDFLILPKNNKEGCGQIE